MNQDKQKNNLNLFWKAQADADHFVIANAVNEKGPAKWVAAVHLNGESVLHQQEEILNAFCAAPQMLDSLEVIFNLHREAQIIFKDAAMEREFYAAINMGKLATIKAKGGTGA